MKLSEFKEILLTKETITFELPDGKLVPSHFHVTEVGQINKRFIDCGGVVRHENRVNFQLWEADDYNHRLQPKKLLSIIELSENKLGIENEEIEVEYQGETIGKYGLEFEKDGFKLTSTLTDCLAKDKCGIPAPKIKISMASMTHNSEENPTCTPGGGCC